MALLGSPSVRVHWKVILQPFLRALSDLGEGLAGPAPQELLLFQASTMQQQQSDIIDHTIALLECAP